MVMRKNKAMPLLLVMVMLFTMFASQLTVYGQGNQVASDIGNSWAKEEITDWINKQLIPVYEDGTFRPNKNITRAEFVNAVNNAFGYKDLADSMFEDVSEDEWYYEEISKAKLAGYITGYDDGTFKPNESISRQEVAKVVYKLIKLKDLNVKNTLVRFKDYSEIPNWSKDYLNIVVEDGYISGYPDRTLRPEQPITRAETVVILDRIVGNLIYAEGTYGTDVEPQVVEGNITINTQDVTLQNTIVKGDLYLAAGIGEGDVYLDNVTVEGRTIVSGGGENSIVINNSTMNEMVVVKVTGRVRIVAKGNTNVTKVIVQSGAKLEEEKGNGKGKGQENNGNGFGDVEILTIKPGEKIELIGRFNDVDVKSSSTVTVGSETTIEKLETSSQDEGTIIDVQEGANLGEIVLNAPTKVKGKGTIKMAVINKEGSDIEQEIEEYQVSEKVKVVVIGGNEVNNEGSEDGSSTGDYTPAPSPTPQPTPTVGTPDPANSGIINQEVGSNGSGEVTLTIGVKDSNNNGIEGYTAQDFGVVTNAHKLTPEAITFADERAFSNFTDNGDGNYSVLLTASRGWVSTFTDLIVDNVEIEASADIQMPESLAYVTSHSYFESLMSTPATIEGIINPDEGKTVTSVGVAIVRSDFGINSDGEFTFIDKYLQNDGTWSTEVAYLEVERMSDNFEDWTLYLTEAQQDAINSRDARISINIKLNDGEEKLVFGGLFFIDTTAPMASYSTPYEVEGNTLTLTFDSDIKVSKLISSETDFSNILGPQWGSATIQAESNYDGYAREFIVNLADDTVLVHGVEILAEVAEDRAGNINTEPIIINVNSGELRLSELSSQAQDYILDIDNVKNQVTVAEGSTLSDFTNSIGISFSGDYEHQYGMYYANGQEVTDYSTLIDETMYFEMTNGDETFSYEIIIPSTTQNQVDAVFIIGDKLYSQSNVNDVDYSSLSWSLSSSTVGEAVYQAVYQSVYFDTAGSIGVFDIKEPINGANYTATLDSTGSQYDSIMLSTTTVTDAVYSEVYSYVYYNGTGDLSFEINSDYTVTDLSNQVPSNATPLTDGDTATVNYNGSVLFEAVWDGVTKVWDYISN